MRKTDTYAAPNFRINIPSTAWYIRDTFNKLTFGFSYTRSTEHSPALVDRTSWSWNARIAYALTFPTDYYLQPFTSLFEGIWLLEEYKIRSLFAPTHQLGVQHGTSRAGHAANRRGQEIISATSASRRAGFMKPAEGGLITLRYYQSVNQLLNLELVSSSSSVRFPRSWATFSRRT
jgi:hypothetical protein